MMNGAMEVTIPPAHKMGIKAVDVRRGYAAASVPLEGNGNHFGVVYAGVQFTVAEILGGMIAIASFDSAKYYPLVKKVDIEFTAAARTDLRAEASLDESELRRVETEAAQHGKADFTMDAVVRDDAGHSRCRHPWALPVTSTREIAADVPCATRVGPKLPVASAVSSRRAGSGRCTRSG